MGGEIDENAEAEVLSELSAAKKTAGLSSQARRKEMKKERKSDGAPAASASTVKTFPVKTVKKAETSKESWFPTQKQEKDGRFFDSTTRAIFFFMLICGVSNAMFGQDWMQETFENAPQKLSQLPSMMQKSGLSMLADGLTGHGDSQPPVTFKTVADGDLSVAAEDHAGASADISGGLTGRAFDGRGVFSETPYPTFDIELFFNRF